MRLIDTSTYHLKELHSSEDIPAYAILSHCWAHPDEEISCDDLRNGTHRTNSYGWRKIVRCCALARGKGLDWAWVDTCCIDKTSSAELTEAINSMFEWYKNAGTCFVFLPDVDSVPRPIEFEPSSAPEDDSSDLETTSLLHSLSRSRWFTRGWTLQELLAPSDAEFYNTDFTRIGTKQSLSSLLASITGIDEAYLKGTRDFRTASVAARMNWASKRATSRIEDIAYSLLGIFDVNMPLIYGEGSKAFLRLQTAIMQSIDDTSIFAWACDEPQRELCGLLAHSPRDFAGSKHIVDIQHHSATRDGGFEVTNKGVRYWYPIDLAWTRKLSVHSMHLPFAASRTRFQRVWQTHTPGRVRTIPLACKDVRRDRTITLHVARVGKRWHRAGVWTHAPSFLERQMYLIAAALLPYRRAHIASTVGPEVAASQGARQISPSTAAITTSALYRFLVTGIFTIAAVLITLSGMDPGLLLRLGLLQLAVEISPLERILLPLIWIVLAMVMNLYLSTDGYP